MGIVIQEKDSSLYLRLPDQWVSEITQATDFGNTANAMRAARQIKGKRIDVLMVFEDRNYDIRLPVPTDS